MKDIWVAGNAPYGTSNNLMFILGMSKQAFSTHFQYVLFVILFCWCCFYTNNSNFFNASQESAGQCRVAENCFGLLFFICFVFQWIIDFMWIAWIHCIARCVHIFKIITKWVTFIQAVWLTFCAIFNLALS